MRSPELPRCRLPWVGIGLLSVALSAGAQAQPAAPRPAAPASAARASAAAQKDAPAVTGDQARKPTPAAQATQRVRILTSKAHAQCPLSGQKMAVLSVDSAQEWGETLQQDETAVAGRSIRWSREQVLVYAMNQQPTLGVSVEPAGQALALKSGVLFWPVHEQRPGPGRMAATATSRPCLVAIVKRAYWQRIRIVRK